MARKARAEAAQSNVNPDDIADCFTEYTEGRARIAREQQKLATMLGNYEKKGVDRKAIKNAYAAAGKDKAEAAAQHRRNSDYLQILQIIEVEPNGQANFDAGLVQATIIPKPSPEASERLFLARAFNDGYNSGLAGGKIDGCSFQVGSEAFVRWRDGWTDGHADRLARNPDADKVTQAAPRKKGKRGAPAAEAAPERETADVF